MTAPDRAASETAIGVARLRAIHQKRDGEPKILDDPVVLQLLDPADLARVDSYDLEAESPLVSGLRSHVVSRSRFTEDRLGDAVARGTTQLVILGAGYDTFAYRQPPWARGLAVFEVDHPASQTAKRQLLAKRGILTPANVHYVSADFEQDGSIAESLRAQHFDPAAPAFVSCLGVIVYLTPTAVDGIFSFVGSLTAGSEFVFTVSAPKTELDDSARAARDALEAAAASVGEPWRTHLSFDQVRGRLLELGFRAITQPSADEIARRYYHGRMDRLRPPRRPAMVVATR